MGLAIQIARHEHQADFRKWEETLQRIESVTLEEVAGAARRYLDLERCTLLEYQPASEEIRQFNSGSYLEFLRMVSASRRWRAEGRRLDRSAPAGGEGASRKAVRQVGAVPGKSAPRAWFRP